MLPRSALSTDTPPPPQHVYVLEPVIQEEEAQDPLQYSKMVVVSAMQEAPCVTEGGDELHYLSVLNKQVRAPSFDPATHLGLLAIHVTSSALSAMHNRSVLNKQASGLP